MVGDLGGEKRFIYLVQKERKTSDTEVHVQVTRLFILAIYVV